MFNWICPQCGTEVLASYSECPECAKRAGAPQPVAAQAAPTAAPPVPQPTMMAPPVAQTPPTQPPVAQPPAAQSAADRRGVAPARGFLFGAPPAEQPPIQQAPPQPQQPYYPPPGQYPQYYAPQPQARRGMPTWLMSILFAAGFAVLLLGVYWLLNHNKGESTSSTAAGTAGAAAGTADANAKPNPLEKFVEVTGVRLYQNSKKQVEAKFLIVNHSDAEMTDLGGTVAIRARTMKEGEEPVGTFKFLIKSLGANDAKEATAPVDTKLKVYELPDWQLVEARVHLTQ